MNNWCDMYPEWGDIYIGNYKDRIDDIKKSHPDEFAEDGSFKGRVKPIKKEKPLNFIQKVKNFFNI
jgi:hypothetical protein